MKKKQKMKKTPDKLTASTVDINRLYEKSVQNTEFTIEMIEKIYSPLKNKICLALREDFCATALLCSNWVKSHPKRYAVGLDNDPKILKWAQKHNIDTLDDKKRVKLLKRDVLQSTREKFDVVSVMNFSYWVFHERKKLIRYFKGVKNALKKDGLFLLDLHGGPDAQFALKELTEFDDFEFIWEQGILDCVNNLCKSRIHFNFPDGSKINSAFVYDWRVWSLPELKEALKDAGFNKIQVWWDDEDDEYGLRIVTSMENTESWIAYIAAWV